MASSLKNIKLGLVVTGETWGGLTFSIDASDDTAYAAALTRVRMSWRAAGAVALTLDSAVAGQITIATATAYGWSFTVEPRALALDPGFYTWAIETTAGVVDKDLLSGTQQIIPDPHA